jgi:nitrate reductase delta subunit
MPETQIDSLQLISLLLQYPDEESLDRLDELASIADQACSDEIRQAIQVFLEELGRLTPIQAQERYTALFDMDPATTLNVTYHLHGDNEKRAAVLARLQHGYDLAGWERITGELPDYLPMMLEFISICPHSAHTPFVWQCLQGVQPLIKRLEYRGSVYACLLQPVYDMAVKRGEQPIEAKA